MKPSYLRSGKASVVTAPCCCGVQLGEIVLRDIEFDFQIVQVGERNHVALGAAIADEAGGDELALLDGAFQNGAGDGRANDGVGQVRLGVTDGAARLVDLAAQGIDLLLARSEFHQLVGLLQRVDAVQRVVVARLRVVHHLLRHHAVLEQALVALEGDVGIVQIGSARC